MCNAHDQDTCQVDQDTCQVLNGEFGGMASTRVEANLCPKIYRSLYTRNISLEQNPTELLILLEIKTPTACENFSDRTEVKFNPSTYITTTS